MRSDHVLTTFCSAPRSVPPERAAVGVPLSHCTTACGTGGAVGIQTRLGPGLVHFFFETAVLNEIAFESGDMETKKLLSFVFMLAARRHVSRRVAAQRARSRGSFALVSSSCVNFLINPGCPGKPGACTGVATPVHAGAGMIVFALGTACACPLGAGSAGASPWKLEPLPERRINLLLVLQGGD